MLLLVVHDRASRIPCRIMQYNESPVQKKGLGL